MRLISAWCQRIGGLLLALAAGHCQSAKDDPTSGETHFLRFCEPDDGSSTCGDGLTCVCNRCTVVCDEANDCSSFAEASCVSVGDVDQCAEASSARMCAVECTRDADCEALSSSHVCAGGACIAGEPPAVDASVCPNGDVSADEVLIIGDSFFAVSHEITDFLQQLARDAGVLSETEEYRDRSSLVLNTLAFMGNGIEQQYVSAVDEGPVRVVIMNGGGADALRGSCETVDAQCPVIAEAAVAAEALLARMAQDDVDEVVYVFYPEAAEEVTTSMVDALRPLVQEACAASEVRCHWIDLRPIFEGNYDEYLRTDGLNPTTAGSEATAEEIWRVMQANCIAQ